LEEEAVGSASASRRRARLPIHGSEIEPFPLRKRPDRDPPVAPLAAQVPVVDAVTVVDSLVDIADGGLGSTRILKLLFWPMICRY
jgi:hypothetical protein